MAREGRRRRSKDQGAQLSMRTDFDFFLLRDTRMRPDRSKLDSLGPIVTNESACRKAGETHAQLLFSIGRHFE